MPNVNDLFPSRFVRADELHRSVQLKIIDVVKERVHNPRLGEIDVWVVYFEKAQKGLILNKVNAMAIAEITGTPHTEHWVGKVIELYPTDVQVAGQTKKAIRVRAP